MTSDWKRLVVNICRLWHRQQFLVHGMCLDIHPTNHDYTSWKPYESFMYYLPITEVVGEVGRLWIWFPPGVAEANEMHLHPVSARRITVAEGGGLFRAVGPAGESIAQPLTVGDQLIMPTNILHTFDSDERTGMLVFAEHFPYVSLTDPLGYVSLMDE